MSDYLKECAKQLAELTPPPNTPLVGVSDFPDDEIRKLGDKIASLDYKRLAVLAKYLESIGVMNE